jgi:hypothetical protein
LSLTGTPSLIRLWREKEDNYEVEEVKEKDPAAREASPRGPTKTGQAETQIAAGGVSKRIESSAEIGCTSHCVSRKEVSGASNRREGTEHCHESEEKTESFTGTPGATLSSDESQVGCEASCRGE